MLPKILPFPASENNPCAVAAQHEPIGQARELPVLVHPRVVISDPHFSTPVAMKPVGLVVLENSLLYSSFDIAGDRANGEVLLHDLTEVISGVDVAGEVCDRKFGAVAGLDLSGGAAPRRATLPAAHRAFPSCAGVFALEPGHHGSLVSRLRRWKGSELRVQVLHAGPHLGFRERSVPNDDLHDAKVRFLPAMQVDVQVGISR